MIFTSFSELSRGAVYEITIRLEVVANNNQTFACSKSTIEAFTKIFSLLAETVLPDYLLSTLVCSILLISSSVILPLISLFSAMKREKFHPQ